MIAAAFTHSEIANLVGSTRQWVTISLNRLQKAGVLTQKRGLLIIRRIEARRRYIALAISSPLLILLIWTHIGTSLARVGIAFIIGASLGIGIGLLRGRIAEIDALLLVPSEILRPIPPLGLIPLFILWFGIGELSKILLIFYQCFSS